jgi:hypothetical protein
MDYNTELSLINTTNSSGNITLPLTSSTPGRVVIFKDILGTFGQNSLTLQCDGADTFEDNGTTKVLREQYGSIQLVASGTKWYILNGTQVNTLQTVNFNVDAISSITISTINTTISTLTFIDNFNSTNTLYSAISSVSTQAVSTNFLYFNNFIIAGTRIGYSNNLNTYFNNVRLVTPPQINNSLVWWLDASDQTTISQTSGNITQWRDKSGSGINLTQRFAGFPTYVINYFNGNNAVRIQGSNQGLQTGNFPTYTNSQLSFFCLMRNVIAGGITSLNSFQYFSLGLSDRLTGNLGSIGNTTNFVNVSINSTLNAGYNLLEIIADSNGTGSLYANGTLYDGPRAVFPPSYFQNDTLVLERDTAVTDAYYFEIIAYRNALSALERQQVEGYLMWKRGLQSNLPLNHRYRYYAP